MESTTIQTIVMTDFRNFTSKEVLLDSKLTLIAGENGRGKTNILEAISFLSSGRSFRAKTLNDCVRDGADVAHLSVTLSVGADESVLGARIVSSKSQYAGRASTRFTRNGVPKRKNTVVGELKSVIFRPEDVEIVTDSPSIRRDFLDDACAQCSTEYRKALQEYERALQHRNMLLLQLREGIVTRRDFAFWDAILIRHADLLTRERSRFLSFVQNAVTFPIDGSIEYDHSLLTESRLHQYANEEVAAGRTLVGPHRDNFLVHLNLSGSMRDVARFGSRGQQRLAVLWLKIAALHYIEENTSISPVLLLDDIFSELDEKNRDIIVSLFDSRQCIITTAEPISILPQVVQDGMMVAL